MSGDGIDCSTRAYLSELARLVNWRLEFNEPTYRLVDQNGTVLLDTVDETEIGAMIDDQMVDAGMFDDIDAELELRVLRSTPH